MTTFTQGPDPKGIIEDGQTSCQLGQIYCSGVCGGGGGGGAGC